MQSAGWVVGFVASEAFAEFVAEHTHQVEFFPLLGNPAAIVNSPQFVKAFYEGGACVRLYVVCVVFVYSVSFVCRQVGCLFVFVVRDQLLKFGSLLSIVDIRRERFMHIGANLVERQNAFCLLSESFGRMGYQQIDFWNFSWEKKT